MPTLRRDRPAPVFLPAAVAIVTLLVALWAGLQRLGWALPGSRLPGVHGPLMALGFLGTLISLERAVALRHPATFLAPVLSAAGALALLAAPARPLGPLLLTAGGIGLVGTFFYIYRLQPALHTATTGLAAALWAGGGILWVAGLPLPRAVLWWAGFLVLTIVGERLELARILRLTRTARAAFAAANALFLAGLLLSLAEPVGGMRLAGAGLLAQAVWLLRYDVARRTVRQNGLPRFMAVCLLGGYVWLALSGVLWAALAGPTAGNVYDALLHTLFVGFVLSMIFGHAPVIFPAIAGVPVAFHPRFYAHVVLLHVSLALRVAGDLAPVVALRQWGGMLNAVAVLLFLAQTARAVRQSAREAALEGGR